MAMYTNTPSVVLTGTVSVSADANTVIGVGTAFLTELTVGAFIDVDGQFFQVTAIGSDTSITVRPVADDEIVGEVAATKQLPGVYSPEYARYVQYYGNDDISKPSVLSASSHLAGSITRPMRPRRVLLATSSSRLPR